MNILFVEDHPVLRYSVSKEMRAHGHVVFEADSAEAAFPLLREHEIDAIISDIGLPGMSGEVFAASARSIRPVVRLIFATGLDYIKDPEDGSGGPIVLRKPYTWTDIEQALEASA